MNFLAKKFRHKDVQFIEPQRRNRTIVHKWTLLCLVIVLNMSDLVFWHGIRPIIWQ